MAPKGRNPQWSLAGNEFWAECGLKDSRMLQVPSLDRFHRKVKAGNGLLDLNLPDDYVDDSDDDEEMEPEDPKALKADPTYVDIDGDVDDELNETEPSDHKIVEFLNSLNPVIIKRHNVKALQAPSFMLRPPFPSQLHAAAAMCHAAENKFGGMILGDRMGGGKTISALLAIYASQSDGRGPSVYVTPAACTRQVVKEIHDFFGAEMPVLLLNDRTVFPEDLFPYKVVVVSYSFLAAEFSAQKRYVDQIKKASAKCDELDKEIQKLDPNEAGTDAEDKLHRQKRKYLPRRPRSCLLSRIFTQPGIKPIGPLLVLDEVHTIKNLQGVTYKAIKALRDAFPTCIMMSGTPMDNSWLDACAYLSLLKGVDISSHYRMKLHFTAFKGEYKSPAPMYKYHPRSQRHLNRIRQVMDAFTLRRPDRSIPGSRYQTILPWELAKEDLEASDREFDEYERLKAMKSEGIPTGEKGTMAQKIVGETSAGWSHLTMAQQIANHPDLVQIYELERAAQEKLVQGGDEAEQADVVESAEQEQELESFMENMAQGENFLSSKVNAIISYLREIRDIFPDDALLLFDDSVYFLDVVAIALSKQEKPIRFAKYNGRLELIKRDALLQDFSQQEGFRVLLCTRGTGGTGLNLQFANHVFRLGPWWKVSWEHQTVGRVDRPGQLKTVYEWQLMPSACKVEYYKAKCRDKKKSIIDEIIPYIEREDDVQLEDGAIIRRIT